MADKIVQLTDKDNNNIFPVTQKNITMTDVDPGEGAALAADNYVAVYGSAGSLVDVFYPVGSVYISLDSSFDPNNAWGGMWTKIESGRFIEATETAADVGTNVSAGLPNITGTWSFARGAYGGQYSTSGAFNYTPRGSTQPASEGGQGDGLLDFDASRANSVYGSSSTVQPKSIRAYIWKRVA